MSELLENISENGALGETIKESLLDHPIEFSRTAPHFANGYQSRMPWERTELILSVVAMMVGGSCLTGISKAAIKQHGKTERTKVRWKRH